MKTRTFLSAFIPMAIGAGALLFMAVRPYERPAQASSESHSFTFKDGIAAVPPPSSLGNPTPMPTLAPPVETPARHISKAVHTSPKQTVSLPSKKGGECTAKTPGVHSSWENMTQESGGPVLFHDCRN
jgi:hypothetical protein